MIKMVEAKQLKKGKFPAPLWLMFPNLPRGTIGWRMGYGEEYRINFFKVLHNKMEFEKLFPEPLNWKDKSFKEFKKEIPSLKFTPLLGMCWRKSGKPEYDLNNLKEDYAKDNEDNIWKNIKNIEIANHFLNIKNEDKKILFATWQFSSVEHAIFSSKVDCFKKAKVQGVPLNNLKHFKNKFTEEEEEIWDKIKYTVCLNAFYYKIMEDEKLKKQLLNTGDKILVYISKDNVWGVNKKNGGENLLGFALMEVRNEIRRITKNENLIDWEYTEYLTKVDPYNNDVLGKNKIPYKIDFNDKDSPEYKIYESTYHNVKYLVRDVNLSPDFESKYEVGRILQEKAFVDATDKVGGMVTSHRFTILTNHMKDISAHEHGTNWNLHVAAANSKFKVLNVYTYKGKTQILLLHLIDHFWQMFKNDDDTIDSKCVKLSINKFQKSVNSNPIAEVTTNEWLKRCEFPIGLNDKGEYWDLE